MKINKIFLTLLIVSFVGNIGGLVFYFWKISPNINSLEKNNQKLQKQIEDADYIRVFSKSSNKFIDIRRSEYNESLRNDALKNCTELFVTNPSLGSIKVKDFTDATKARDFFISTCMMKAGFGDK